jgi:ribonuclease HI
MIKLHHKPVTLYTDGSCKNNPGPGGWAAILICDSQEKIVTGSEPYTTNNRMELLSVINALNSLKSSCKISLYTDSQYVKQGISVWLPNWRTKNWRTASGSPVKNQDLWETLDLLVKKHEISWHWVKAHNGHLFNERVDVLAKQAIKCDK